MELDGFGWMELLLLPHHHHPSPSPSPSPTHSWPTVWIVCQVQGGRTCHHPHGLRHLLDAPHGVLLNHAARLGRLVRVVDELRGRG